MGVRDGSEGIEGDLVYRRLFGVLVVVALMLTAVPLVATAATPNIARVSAVTYRDMAGSETDSLCAVPTVPPTGPSITTTIGYSGTGAELGGNGTGQMSITLNGSTFDLSGQATVNGKTLTITGTGSLQCIMSGYALVTGAFNASATSGSVTAAAPAGVSGSLLGYISDGVHPSQGRVSLTLREEAAAPPTTTSLEVQTTLDGSPVANVAVTLYEGGVCGSGVSQVVVSDVNGVASFPVTGGTQYCASADPNADTTPTTFVTSVPAGDPVDVDATIAETSPVVTSVDVLVNLDTVPASNVTVTFYSDGACTTPLGTAVTGSDGVASLTVAGAGTYCASADPNTDQTASNTGAMTIADGDPVDTDGTINEAAVATFMDVLVTEDGAAVAGVTVRMNV